MSVPYRIIGDPAADVLVVADHASNRVPDGIDLGIDPRHLEAHIAVDIGIAGVAERLVAGGGVQAILATVSRLVIDLNREPDAPGLVPQESDGVALPGNARADVARRLATIHAPYHAAVAALAGAAHRPFILSLHSFTPVLASRPAEARPWHVGVLYNADARAAPHALAALQRLGHVVGDQLPYSGRVLNATMNRHAEAHGRPYLGVEIRQDLIADAAGQARLARDLAQVVAEVRQALQHRAG